MDSKPASVTTDESLAGFSPKFIWPREENPNSTTHPETEAGDLNEPLIDLQPFFNGDEEQIQKITEQVRSTCLSHGLFQVINHGVDLELIESVEDCVKGFFRLPVEQKMRAQTRPGKLSGYSLAHKDRFLTNLPWKETISCFFSGGGGGIGHDSSDEAAGFLETAFGEASQQTGGILQEYCKAMKRLSLTIMEILGRSLGLRNHSFYRDFFQDADCILRCNFYPPCQEPGLALGTGPHSDPTALTILHQDHVGGLQVLSHSDDDVDHMMMTWKPVRPRPGALVVNLGDTFVAMTNGEYKSCKHRAVVNRTKERVSMVVFLCPREDKVIAPPEDLTLGLGCGEMYPRFTWSDFHNFTHKHYRVDLSTLQNFAHWIITTRNDDQNQKSE